MPPKSTPVGDIVRKLDGVDKFVKISPKLKDGVTTGKFSQTNVVMGGCEAVWKLKPKTVYCTESRLSGEYNTIVDYLGTLKDDQTASALLKTFKDNKKNHITFKNSSEDKIKALIQKNSKSRSSNRTSVDPVKLTAEDISVIASAMRNQRDLFTRFTDVTADTRKSVSKILAHLQNNKDDCVVLNRMNGDVFDWTVAKSDVAKEGDNVRLATSDKTSSVLGRVYVKVMTNSKAQIISERKMEASKFIMATLIEEKSTSGDPSVDAKTKVDMTDACNNITSKLSWPTPVTGRRAAGVVPTAKTTDKTVKDRVAKRRQEVSRSRSASRSRGVSATTRIARTNSNASESTVASQKIKSRSPSPAESEASKTNDPSVTGSDTASETDDDISRTPDINIGRR